MLDARVRAAVDAFDLAVDLSLEVGEVVAVLGPNGAGKTTLLRVLAGLLGAGAGGRVQVGDVVVDDPAAGRFTVPERRSVGLVFQDGLLFPHLTLVDNVAFGLRADRVGRAEARRRAAGWLDRLGIGDLATRKPGAVSGGQAQRAALARALATGPDVLLLDEPLSARDGPRRAELRRDLRRHLTEFGGATVLVTHDPLDALALADRIVILEGGRVTQEGTVAEVTVRPRTRYVAELVGVNLLRGVAVGTTVTLDSGGVLTLADPADGPVLALVAPRSVALQRDEPQGSARNRWEAEITGFDLLGDRVRVRLAGPVPLVAEVTPDAVAALRLVEGDRVWASVKATEVTAYPA